MPRPSARSGFTLIELLVGLGIIGVLASIVIVAVNPTKQLSDARDAERLIGVREIQNALIQRLIDVSGTADTELDAIPTGANNAQPICAHGITDDDCLNLTEVLVPDYLPRLPQDVAAQTPFSGYSIYRDEAGRFVSVANHLGGEQSTEVSASCGNGVTEDAEECDDGNEVCTDGCCYCEIPSGSCNSNATCNYNPEDCLSCSADCATCGGFGWGGAPNMQFLPWQTKDVFWLFDVHAQALPNFEMTATVPDEFVINSITPSVGSCNIAGQVVTCSVDPSPQWFIINYTMNLTAPGATDSYPMSFAANYPFFNTGPNLIVNTCGNSIVEGSEQCDDGNSNYGDGCTPDCQAW